MKLRKRHKLGLGLGFGLVLLSLGEGLARLVLGPPPPPVMKGTMVMGSLDLGVREGVFQVPYQQPPLAPVAVPKAGTRIVFLGGSSVHALPPPQPEQEWPHLVGEALGVEAVNLGNVGFDSSDLADVASQIEPLEADLVVIYAGHNELGNAWMMERYSGVQGGLRAFARTGLERLWSYSALKRAMSAPLARRPPGQTPPVLTQAQREAALGHFEANLERIAWSLRGTPLVLSTVASNLAIEPTETCREEGCPWPLWESARREPDPARRREILVAAKDLDPMSIRAPSEINAIIRRVAAEQELTLMELKAELPREQGADIPAQRLFRDTLHFSDAGMFEVADTVAAWLRENELP